VTGNDAVRAQVDVVMADPGNAARISDAPVRGRTEALDALAAAAVRYRKAVQKGKGRKAAQARLFEAVAAWKAFP
jgi:hypothetical protein